MRAAEFDLKRAKFLGFYFRFKKNNLISRKKWISSVKSVLKTQKKLLYFKTNNNNRQPLHLLAASDIEK